MTASDVISVARELVRHLRSEEGLPGLPEEWFQAVAEERVGLAAEHCETAVRGEVEGALATEFTGDMRERMAFTDLLSDAMSCVRCRLSEQRNKVVFGVGNTRIPPVAFVGEGPGADEDRLGEPFVGKAGALLTAAITKGMGLRREDVYICNVVKCRPPQNRAPLPDETAVCTPFLFRQLELIQPQVIITLGAPAQLAVSGLKGGITKIRGNWQCWRGIPVMPTFHPAYLLRSPSAKKFFWEDLKSVMKHLNLPLTGS